MFNWMRQTMLVGALVLPVWNSAALADSPRVVTDIAPVQSLVARVMGGLGAPAVLVRPGVSPHGYAMRPSDARALQNADAVIWIGAELTPWLSGALATLAGDADMTALLDAPGTDLLQFREEARFAPHSDESAEEAEEDGHGHDENHTGIDPHAWLDPENARQWLGVIADILARLDPENAPTYLANAKAGQAELDVLMADLRRSLEPVRARPFVVFHDAFHYFEYRFGLSAAGAIALGDASDPGPARVESVRHTVQELGITCVLSEPAFNPSLVRTVTEGTGARIGLIDPLGGDIAPGAAFYPALMRAVAAELIQCLE